MGCSILREPVGMIKIRRADYSDKGWLLKQVKSFMLFADCEDLYDAQYLEEFITSCIKDHFFIIAHDDGLRMGMLAALLTPHLFNPKKTMLAELCWWVPVEYRSTRAGLALLTTYIEWGKRNADIVVISSLSSSPISETSLTKRGFTKRETSFVLEN